MMTIIAAVIAKLWIIPMINPAANTAIFADLIKAFVFTIMAAESSFWAGGFWARKLRYRGALAILMAIAALAMAAFYSWSGAVDLFAQTITP